MFFLKGEQPQRVERPTSAKGSRRRREGDMQSDTISLHLLFSVCSVILFLVLTKQSLKKENNPNSHFRRNI